eukprot:268081-Pyramimonas_sp.AAC.1
MGSTSWRSKPSAPRTTPEAVGRLPRGPHDAPKRPPREPQRSLQGGPQKPRRGQKMSTKAVQGASTTEARWRGGPP